MRLGGPVLTDFETPGEWIDALEERGYSTAPAPIGPDADADTIEAYREAAETADVTIAEVGAWEHNSLADDPTEREAAIEACARHLELADDIGARCCVNVPGSRGDSWASPHPANYSDETFDRIVASVREIIDRADPQGAAYTLEPMPWIPPDSIDSQRALLDAVDREHFGVHFDPVNLITSPRLWAENGDFLRRFVDEFGPEIRAVHLKDVTLADELTVHVEEVRPGKGDLDLHAALAAFDELDDDLPVLLEHLDSEEEYAVAASAVRSVADDLGVDLGA